MNDRPIDIVKCNISPQLLHEMPYLVCALEIKNDASVGKYLFPGAARLEMFDQLVDITIATLESPGARGRKQWETTCEGGGISQTRFYWKSGKSRNIYCCFIVNAMVLNSLEGGFEKKRTCPYQIDLELPIIEEQTMMVPSDTDAPTKKELIPKASEGIRASIEGNITIHEWREWTKAWGVACEAIYLPTKLIDELRTIKPLMGVGFEWEVISELAKSYQGLKAEVILVTGKDDLLSKMTEIITSAGTELLIMCRAFDETLYNPLCKAQDRGVEIKIVTVPTPKLKAEKYQEISRLEAAFNNASQRFQVKKNIKQHSRIIISDSAVLVGSTDPDYYGLNIHENASIYTLNPTVVNAARLFFNKVWQESNAL